MLITSPPFNFHLAQIVDREQRRQHQQTMLWHTERSVRNVLQALPDDNPQSLRIRTNEKFVMRQCRARNPDSVLAWGLRARQLSYRDFFRDNPAVLATYRDSAEVAHQLMTGADEFDEHVCIKHLQECQSVVRLINALLLAALICAERGSMLQAIMLERSAWELYETLQGAPPDEAAQAEHHKAIWACQEMTLEEQVIIRRNCGYQFEKIGKGQDPSFGTHPAGGILIAKRGAPCFEIDVSLLTDDRNAFPDPHYPITVVQRESGRFNVLYIDFDHRQRELTHKEESDEYVFA